MIFVSRLRRMKKKQKHLSKSSKNSCFWFSKPRKMNFSCFLKSLKKTYFLNLRQGHLKKKKRVQQSKRISGFCGFPILGQSSHVFGVSLGIWSLKRSTNLGGLRMEWRVHRLMLWEYVVPHEIWFIIMFFIVYQLFWGIPPFLGKQKNGPAKQKKAQSKNSPGIHCQHSRPSVSWHVWHSVVASPLISSCFLPISTFSPRDTTSTKHPNMCICATISLGLIWLWVKI